MEKIIILMIMLMLTGCTNEGISDTPVPTPTLEPIVSVEPTVTPTVGQPQLLMRS